MIKLGFEFRDDTYTNKNFTVFNEGNIGVGGTQYEFALLIHNLKTRHKDFEFYVFHKNDNIFEEGLHLIKYNSVSEIPKLANENEIDILIFWTMHDLEWYDNLEKYSIISIGWAHNFLDYPLLMKISRNRNIKKLVCVGREQYELLAAESCFNKSTYIFNMFDLEQTFCIPKRENIVCYMGSLVEPKGFHVLAKIWKKIIKEVPNARLLVLGSGKTYNDNAIMGSYGIAEQKYEDKFIKYLVDSEGHIVNSVQFLGNVGLEKYEIINKCKVGVVNPTANSETFCISAVEMEAVGVPVCTKNKYGLKDTVLHNETGLLSNSNTRLCKDIVKLLKDEKLYIDISENTIAYARKFKSDNIIIEWDKIFDEILKGDIPTEKIVERHKVRYIIGLIRNKYKQKWILTPYQLEYLIQLPYQLIKTIVKNLLVLIGLRKN